MAKFFDVIIVGAGPAGSVAALKLAKAGFKVALLERGQHPGSKNMFGGILHNTPVLNEQFPCFWDKAPVERHVYKKTLSFMTSISSTSISFATESFDKVPYNGYTVMRPVFDNWLAGEAVKEGAMLLCNCTAEDLIWKGDKVAGVTIKGRPGELKSKMVIAADGVLSFMAHKANLRKEFLPANMGLGIKLLLALTRDTIDERFGLARDEGADYSLLGITEGLRGGGFLYTNNESISIGLVIHLDSLKSSGKTPYDIANKLLQHPQIIKLIKGGVLLEYSAHLVPESGIKGIPKVYTGGLLVAGDAAGLCYTNGINLEGINLAMTSGALAADSAIEAFEANDFSAQMLSGYKKRLDASFIFKDMLTFKNAVDMMHIERLYQIYPELVSSTMEKIYRVDGAPRSKIFKLIQKELSGKVKTIEILGDGIKVKRALL